MNYAVSNECLLAEFLIRADYRCVFVCYLAQQEGTLSATMLCVNERTAYKTYD